MIDDDLVFTEKTARNRRDKTRWIVIVTPFPTVMLVIIMFRGNHLLSAQFLTLIAHFSQNYNDNLCISTDRMASYYLWFHTSYFFFVQRGD